VGQQVAGGQLRRAAADQRGEEHRDGDRVGGHEQSEEGDAGVAHPSRAELGERHREQDDDQDERRRGEHQPHPPRQVDGRPALGLVDDRQADEQRDVEGQDDRGLAARLAHRAAGVDDRRLGVWLVHVAGILRPRWAGRVIRNERCDLVALGR
jgi:hypothetical protein